MWDQALEHVVSAAFAPGRPQPRLARALADRGADACNRATDEPLGRCMNYATETLSLAVAAADLQELAPLKKQIKMAAAIPPVVAAALPSVEKARDPVRALRRL